MNDRATQENPYRSPSADGRSARCGDRLERRPRTFRHALRTGVALQGLMLILTALVLDGGRMFRLCLIAAISYWALMVLVGRHRAARPAQWDLLPVRYGMVGLFATAVFSAAVLRMWNASR